MSSHMRPKPPGASWFEAPYVLDYTPDPADYDDDPKPPTMLGCTPATNDGGTLKPVEMVYPSGTLLRAAAFDPSGQTCLVEWVGPTVPDWTSVTTGQAIATFTAFKGRPPSGGPWGEVS